MIKQQPTWYLALVALLTVSLDQLAKYFVTANLAFGESWMPLEWLAPIVSITHVRNTGAAFGIFPAGGAVFAIIGVIVVGAIVYYYHELPPGEWMVRTALGLQLGGALGNLTDRFRLGYVTDFINFNFFPVFNVADSSIVIGVALLIIVMLLEERREAREGTLDPDEERSMHGPEGDFGSPVERPDSPTP